MYPELLRSLLQKLHYQAFNSARRMDAVQDIRDHPPNAFKPHLEEDLVSRLAIELPELAIVGIRSSWPHIMSQCVPCLQLVNLGPLRCSQCQLAKLPDSPSSTSTSTWPFLVLRLLGRVEETRLRIPS